MSTTIGRYLELTAFKTLAELRSERQRTYLGFLWWFFEPAFFMLVFYFVFDVFMHRGGPDFVPGLLCGLVLWQWFNNAVMHCATVVQAALPMLRSVRVPVTVFPLSTLLADTVKFAFVFIVLVILLACLGHMPGSACAALPLVLLAEFALTCGACFLLAGLVPFIPDLRFVVMPLLQGMFFLSGIFFSLDSVSQPGRWWLELNPMAVIIDMGRGILLDDVMPEPSRLGLQLGIGFAVLVLGAVLIARLSPRYSKLMD